MSYWELIQTLFLLHSDIECGNETGIVSENMNTFGWKKSPAFYNSRVYEYCSRNNPEEISVR